MTIVWYKDGIGYFRHDTKEEFATRVEAFAYIIPRKPTKKRTSRKKK